MWDDRKYTGFVSRRTGKFGRTTAYFAERNALEFHEFFNVPLRQNSTLNLADLRWNELFQRAAKHSSDSDGNRGRRNERNSRCWLETIFQWKTRKFRVEWNTPGTFDRRQLPGYLGRIASRIIPYGFRFHSTAIDAPPLFFFDSSLSAGLICYRENDLNGTGKRRTRLTWRISG